MSILQLVVVIVLPWALIHILHLLYRRGVHDEALFPVPISATGPRTSLGMRSKLKRQGDSIELGPLWLKYETTRWNWLFSPSMRFCRSFYAVGSALCILVLVLVTFSLLWSGIFTISRIILWLTTTHQDQHYGKAKRTIEDAPHSPPGHWSELHTLIPGVTTPLSELPILFVALTLSAAIHEAGHAVSAALESIPTLSVGFHLYLAIPAFFVSLRDFSLPTAARVRIASAGPWHNICMWIIFALLGFSGISRIPLLTPTSSADIPSMEDLSSDGTCSSTGPSGTCSASIRGHTPFSAWSYLGYVNTQARGLVVNGVSPESPLYGHLNVGSVIVQIDDQRLAAAKQIPSTAMDIWSAYLSIAVTEASKMHSEAEGWCVPDHWFDSQKDTCCYRNITDTSASNAVPSSNSCFKSRIMTTTNGSSEGSPPKLRCLDPVGLFTYQHRIAHGEKAVNPVAGPSSPDTGTGGAYGSRCHDDCSRSAGDNGSYTCVQLHLNRGEDDQRLTRLEVEAPPWLHEHSGPPTRIIIYKGPTSEILDHVSVGFLQPRTSIFPPMFLPHFIQSTVPAIIFLLCEYIGRMSLSLAIFNLLPIRGLDGGVIFSCILQWLLSKPRGRRREEFDGLELLEWGESSQGLRRGPSSWGDERSREKIERVVSTTTVIMCALVVTATVWADIVS
ncbi:hypothetical protein FRC15_001195 [Serendipita sp. 397]|nr:hypothetical protein FRC15_001195 [Serendipita sp. 397]KAG8778690.1 hypothetical protein FRC16_003756 [Serendipita sp. 398]